MELFKTVFLGKNNVSTDIYIVGVGGGGKGIGMCAKGYSFLAFLVCKRVSILTISVWNNVWFVPSSPELFFSEATWSDDFPFNVYANHLRAATVQFCILINPAYKHYL